MKKDWRILIIHEAVMGKLIVLRLPVKRISEVTPGSFLILS